MSSVKVKLVVVMVAFAVGCVPVSATVVEKFIDFESPAYTLGNLDGQNGWIAAYSDHLVQNTDVLSGGQSVSSGVGNTHSYAILPLSQSNLNFQDGYVISYLVKMENKSYGIVQLDAKTGDNVYDAYVQVLHDARLSATDRIKVNGTYIGSAGYFKEGEIHQVNLVLDFTNHKVDVSIKEISGDTPGNVVSQNGLDFLSPVSTDEAKDGQFKLRAGYVYNDVTGIQVVDDITFAVPEPATIGLLTFGATSLIRRR